VVAGRAALLETGFGPRVAWLGALAAGPGALAASTACSTAFAAWRVPYPIARPKRTLSIAFQV
jgi:hypothetical protein